MRMRTGFKCPTLRALECSCEHCNCIPQKEGNIESPSWEGFCSSRNDGQRYFEIHVVKPRYSATALSPPFVAVGIGVTWGASGPPASASIFQPRNS
jgi:hypothetical protein